MSRAAGRPFPRLSDDDVIDYLLMETTAHKIAAEEAEERKNKEREDFRKSHKDLRNRR